MFRFNRRRSKHRGLLFHTLLRLTMQAPPRPCEMIAANVPGDGPPDSPVEDDLHGAMANSA